MRSPQGHITRTVGLTPAASREAGKECDRGEISNQLQLFPSGFLSVNKKPLGRALSLALALRAEHGHRTSTEKPGAI